MGYYGGGGTAKPTYKPAPLPGVSGGGSLNAEFAGPAPSEDIGKGSIDVTDPVQSIGKSLGSFVDFAATGVGGIAGAIGSLGPDGDTASIGQLVEDLGRIPGGVGDFKLPYLGNDPTKQQATLSEVPGLIGDVASALGRFAEFETAKARVRTAQQGLPGLGEYAARRLGTDVHANDLPADLQAALDAGVPVDVIAEELVNRGEGFTSLGGPTNFVAQVVLDPLNLIAPGASKAFQATKGAGIAVRAAEDGARLGLSTRAVGTIYNAASNGLSRAGAATVDAVVGPVTSGVFHTLGTSAYKGLISNANRLDRAYGEAFERSFALGAGQLPRAVIAREIMNDVGARVAQKVDDVESAVRDRLHAKRTVANDELERRTEELLARVTPDYPVITDDITSATVRKYAAVTGMSPEDAARVLGKVDRDTARTVHLAYYGKAGGELAEIKATIPSTKKIDVERLTVIAPDTLTDELADAILAGDISGAAAVSEFSVLANHFGGKVPSESDVMAFVSKLKDEGALPEVVRLPKSGKNPLPRALGDWRARNAEFGYELGFAPKDGWKAIVDVDGNIVANDPFVHFVNDVEPVTMRNPLGRFMDGLFRGVTQTTVVQASRQRMVDFMVRSGLPVSPNQIRSLHKSIIEAAADARETPRALEALKTGDGSVITSLFRKFLTDDEFAAVTAKYDPWYIVNKAFQGDLTTVGLTQKVTGGAKALPVGGQVITRITENLYPKARFTYRPNFQAQEAIESPVFNTLRGVTDRPVSDEIVEAYRGLAEQPEFKYLTEANFLQIMGERTVSRFMGSSTPVGRAMGRFVNIAQRKNQAMVRQVMYEHGEQFREAVQQINPKFWKAMEEAYGTTDARLIADQFLAERLTLGSAENIDDAMRLVDSVAPALEGSAGEQVLQAFKDSFRQASNQAFQTHFFNPQRGWLERSLNHPYLGLYPLSYMWGKVLPEFARFLLKRPFGADAPLVGLANLERVQQAYLGALAEDPEFNEFIQQNEGAIYFANLLFPGNPVNMAVNAPAWARHIAADVRVNESRPGTKNDRKLDANTVAREVYDSTSYALNPVSDIMSVAKVATTVGSNLPAISEDIYQNLDAAAAAYDGQFPTSAPPSLGPGTPLVQQP